MGNARTCLYREDWPVADQEAFSHALRKDGLFEVGEAEHWAPDTVDRRERSWGTFLFFARSVGQLRAEMRPAERASGPLLEEFIEDLTDRVAPVSVAIILSGMAEMLRILDPRGDRTAVVAAARYFERTAKPVRDVRKILVGASELYYAGIERMRGVIDNAASDARAAMVYEDGLLIAMPTIHPVRLKNLHATRIGVHLVRRASGHYDWRFAASETKNHKPIMAELPPSLSPFLERWLQDIRPSCLRDREHDAMWVTTRGAPMSRTTLYTRLCNATHQQLHVRIYPHAIRHIAATSIAVSMPENVRMIPFLTMMTAPPRRTTTLPISCPRASSI